MTTGEKIEKYFPGVAWTGGSNIHKSIYGDLGVEWESGSVRSAMKTLMNNNTGFRLWKHLHKDFGKCEWLIDEHQFTALLMQDIYGHLVGTGSTKTPGMLKNPSTGNIFHRMALIDDIVGGIRYWVDWGVMYYRFRLEKQVEEEAKTRITIAQSAETAVIAVANIMDILEIKEPEKATNEEAVVSEYELL